MHRKQGSMESRLAVRLVGAALGSVGFFLLANRQTVIGTSLVGIGSLLIAVGE